jgi:hypothetical protein
MSLPLLLAPLPLLLAADAHASVMLLPIRLLFLPGLGDRSLGVVKPRLTKGAVVVDPTLLGVVLHMPLSRGRTAASLGTATPSPPQVEASVAAAAARSNLSSLVNI